MGSAISRPWHLRCAELSVLFNLSILPCFALSCAPQACAFICLHILLTSMIYAAYLCSQHSVLCLRLFSLPPAPVRCQRFLSISLRLPLLISRRECHASRVRGNSIPSEGLRLPHCYLHVHYRTGCAYVICVNLSFPFLLPQPFSMLHS
jgi:hypothetical protein